jgi:hypothetical protein
MLPRPDQILKFWLSVVILYFDGWLGWERLTTADPIIHVAGISGSVEDLILCAEASESLVFSPFVLVYQIFYADNNPKDRAIMEGASTTSSTSSVDGRTSSDYLSRGTFTTSQHQQNDGSTLLTGFAGANGFSNDVGTSFDLNEFPSLGSSVGGGNSNGLAAAMREQQQLLAQQQSMQGPSQYTSPSTTASRSTNLYMQAMTGTNGNNFSMANEDFPALGGGNSAGGGLSGMSSNNSSGALNVSSLLSNSSPFQLNSNAAENNMYNSKPGLETGTSQLEGHAGLLGGAGLGNVSAPIPVATVPSNLPAGNALGGDFGLLGLLGIIRMTDADRNALALGSDLQLLGLNLGSTEQIFGTFASPWSESNTGSKEPHFQVCT